MSIDKVQLQQQEVINDEVVLTDINPITSTDSVFDPTSGSSMQEVIDRLWNAINSKLPRVVNSVNNRTGAVVLNPGDVGLGNVDDVSFNDIKNWVIEYFSSKMAKYRFKLYDTFQEVIDEAGTNERSLDSVPFYVKSIDGVDNPSGDKRSCIGYFYWNDTNSSINYIYKHIDVVGAVDNSLNYDNGHLNVKIHPDEDALYVDNGEEDPTKTGLRIHPDKFASEMLSSPCIYGYTVPTDPKGLLAANPESITPEQTEVHIFIDNVEIPYQTKEVNGTTITIPHYLHKNWVGKLKMYTQVITEFKGKYTGGYRREDNTTPIADGEYASLTLMDRQPAIGVVTYVPTDDDNPPYYEIKFTTIKTFESGMGLRYVDNHETTQKSEQLAIDMFVDETGGLSGLAAKAIGLLPSDETKREDIASSIQDFAYRPQAPYGDNRRRNPALYPTKGLIVATDDTICRYPIDKFNPSGNTHTYTEKIDGEDTPHTDYNGSKIAENWSPVAYHGFTKGNELTGDLKPDGPDNGYLTSTSYLSVNMNKLVRDANYEILTDESAPLDWETITPYDQYYYAKSVGYDDYIYEKIEGRRPTYEPGIFAKKLTTEKKFHFTNLSGLKSTHLSIDGKDPTDVDTRYSELTESELKSIGIYDGKDSLGYNIELYPFNKFSGGLSVNVGNFLEICPQETSYGRDYDDSGKVNVRIGKGLTDEYTLEEVDITQYTIKDGPPDLNEHPELFMLKNHDGTFEEIPSDWKYYNIGNTPDKKPDDWEDNYYNYFVQYTRDIPGSETCYVQLQKVDEIPPFPPYDGTSVVSSNVYKNNGVWQNVFIAIDQTYLYDGLYKKIRNNRIGVNVDNRTIYVNEDTKQLCAKGINQFNSSTGSYTKGQMIYDIIRGVNIIYRVNQDFNADGTHSIFYYSNIGVVTQLTYIPDGDTISMYNGFISSTRKISVYEPETDYHAHELVYDGNGRPQVYVVLDDYSSENIAHDKTAGKLYEITTICDGETIRDYGSGFFVNIDDRTLTYESTNSGAIVAHPFAEVYRQGVQFKEYQLFTNEAKTGFYMAKGNFTATGTIDNDMAYILVIKSPT